MYISSPSGQESIATDEPMPLSPTVVPQAIASAFELDYVKLAEMSSNSLLMYRDSRHSGHLSLAVQNTMFYNA